MAKRGIGVSYINEPLDLASATSFSGGGHRRRRKERLEYDTTPARTVLAIVGVAVAIVLLWLEYQGY